MPTQPHRALRIIVGVLSVVVAAAGLVFIFGGRGLVMSLPFHPPESEVSTLLLLLLKETGGIAVMVSFMLYFAWRDPVRNVAIVNGLIGGLCVLAVTPLISLYTLDLGGLYPGYAIWGRSVIRLILAAVLYFLRPREAGQVREQS